MFKKKENKSLHDHLADLSQRMQEVKRNIEIETALQAYARLNQKVNLLAEKLGYKFEIEPAKNEQLIIKKK